MNPTSPSFLLSLGPSLFVVFPFFLSSVLPAIAIPWIALRFLKAKGNPKTLRVFTLLLIVGAIIGAIVWETRVFDVVYHEWDRGFLSYSFLYHETPALGKAPVLQDGKMSGEGSWIQANIGFFGLSLIWLLITYAIYAISGMLTFLLLGKKHAKQIFTMVTAMCLVSLPFTVDVLGSLASFVAIMIPIVLIQPVILLLRISGMVR